MGMSINVEKLDTELRTAGIPITGCSSCGRIDFKPGTTQQQKDLAQTILEAHDPALTVAQELRETGYSNITLAFAVILSTKSTNAQRAWAQTLIETLAAKVPSQV